jgi:hypothetical protein
MTYNVPPVISPSPVIDRPWLTRQANKSEATKRLARLALGDVSLADYASEAKAKSPGLPFLVDITSRLTS